MSDLTESAGGTHLVPKQRADGCVHQRRHHCVEEIVVRGVLVRTLAVPERLGARPSAQGGGGGGGGGGTARTGAGGDNGIAKMWNCREISVSSYYDQSTYLHPHPYGDPGADRRD
jgi:hypothetical protein